MSDSSSGSSSEPQTSPSAPPVISQSSTASRLAVILVSPKTPGNMGAAARAMLNMGASDLRLVAPRGDHLSSEATALAVHAAEVLRGAKVYVTLADALADRDLSIGTTARHRADLPDPLHPASLRPLVRTAHAPALVFGPEESGLSNEDLELCQASVRVPTSEYASLNLAQAVLLVCYEFLQGQDGVQELPARKAASRSDMDGMYAHLKDTILITGYTDEVRSVHTLRLWRTWMDRAQMNAAETRLFRGLLRQVRWKIGEARKAAGMPPLPPAPLSEREQLAGDTTSGEDGSPTGPE